VVVQVVMAYTVGVAAMLAVFAACPASTVWLQWASVFMIGFFLYGPQMLIGLCGAELVGEGPHHQQAVPSYECFCWQPWHRQ
jgi:sugar phosphate permease